METAIIIGAGVAGPVAAMALQRAGIAAEVFEAHPQGADEVGAFLTLQTNGRDALRAIDADGVVAAVGFSTPRQRFHSGTGRYLGELPIGGTLPDGTVSLTLRRGDLHRVLREEALARGVRIRYGARLVDVGANGDGRVVARFADGSEAAGDVLVGADGVRSRVRRLIDPAAPEARYTGLLDSGGVAPLVPAEGRPGVYGMVFGKRAFFGYAVAPAGETWWFANVGRAEAPARGELAATDPEQWRAHLLEQFADDRSPAGGLIRATPGPLRPWAIHDLQAVPVWHRDRMVVIGDAAHATSPSSGQGASMAIEDAVVLAQCLRDLPDTAAAFRHYEQLRRARVERVVAAGARISNTKAVGPVARVIRDAVMPLALRAFGERQAASLAWLHTHHIDWNAPAAA